MCAFNLAAPCETVPLGICGQRRPRSACASTQSDQGLRCPQTEWLDTIDCFNGEQKPGWHFAHVQDGMNMYIFRACSKGLLAWRRPFWRKHTARCVSWLCLFVLPYFVRSITIFVRISMFIYLFLFFCFQKFYTASGSYGSCVSSKINIFLSEFPIKNHHWK